jgi:endo-1,4-beta-D-glucanase Y/4-amino-4-deoxy-L-arabinose transferase-like glycosyltransferase
MSNHVYQDEKPVAREQSRPGSWLDRSLAAFWGVPALVTALVLLGLFAHAYNMFHYPSHYRLDDEGIYISQAWAVLREGSLSPYTYWYDHAPAGWIFLAGWMWLTGGPQAFGTAIDSARVFMLVLHLAMIPLLFFLARKLGVSIALAAFAAFLFSVSPLAITYQRLVLLDNIMMFWIMVSLNLLLDGWGRLSRTIFSGITFAVAMLTKETAVFLLPAVLFIAYQQRWKHQGGFAIWGWVLPMLMVLSFYPLYAAIKGELLPAGMSVLQSVLPSFLADRFASEQAGVTLTETLKWQATRGGGGGILESGSMFWTMVRDNWLRLDPFLLIGGTLAVILNLIRGLRDRRLMAASLLGIFPLVYLARGGIVFDFYIIFAVPFLALNLAVLLTPAFEQVRTLRFDTLGPGLLAVALVAFYALSGNFSTLYEYRPDQPVRTALPWIKQNIPANSRMVINDNLWTDLREPGYGGPPFRDAHSHWKVATDPEVHSGVFAGDWQNIDYIILMPGLAEDFAATGNELALEALENSTLVQRWGDDESFVEVWKTNKPTTGEMELLEASRTYIRKNFSSRGAYYDPSGAVFSENQAYAMLRSVWMDDRAGFYQAWGWSRDNLLMENGLMAWLWQDGQVLDEQSATDADTDAALALLFAGKRWDDPALIEAGVQMVQAIRENTVVEVGGQPYLTAGEWATSRDLLVLNPSYFSPYAYRVFNEVDPDQVWWDLIETSYRVIFESAENPLGKAESAGLPPDWIGLNRYTGELVAVDLDGIRDTTVYGYEAARTYWRVALDFQYTEDGRAAEFLELAGFLEGEISQKGYPSAVYSKDGQILEEPPSMVGIAGALAALLVLDPPAAHEFYVQQVKLPVTRYADRSISWGNPRDLYTQEWGWFAVGLYAEALPNLWWHIPGK